MPGLRIGESKQLCKQVIIIKNKQFTMIHVCRGGSIEQQRREDRFGPIHPKIANFSSGRKMGDGVLLPDMKARELLND
jgi:hypothetical protein